MSLIIFITGPDLATCGVRGQRRCVSVYVCVSLGVRLCTWLIVCVYLWCLCDTNTLCSEILVMQKKQNKKNLTSCKKSAWTKKDFLHPCVRSPAQRTVHDWEQLFLSPPTVSLPRPRGHSLHAHNNAPIKCMLQEQSLKPLSPRFWIPSASHSLLSFSRGLKWSCMTSFTTLFLVPVRLQWVKDAESVSVTVPDIQSEVWMSGFHLHKKRMRSRGLVSAQSPSDVEPLLWELSLLLPARVSGSTHDIHTQKHTHTLREMK